MKLAFFDDFKLGVIRADRVVDVSAAVADIPRLGPHDLINTLIENFADYRARLESAAAAGAGVPVGGVRFRPPLPRPSSIDCMAVNYMENGARKEPAPINAFHKPSCTIIGDGDDMVLADVPAAVFEGEAEIAVVFGRRGRNISEANAFDHVFGYVNLIDGSARGLGPGTNLYFLMKSWETFCPIGPYLVTKDEIPDPHKVQVRLWNNGQLKQDYNTDDMAHNIAKCIAWVSSVHTVQPGDILAMGTNHGGLHAFQDGDRIELECAGLGRLHVKVRDDLKRTWSRETHHDRELKGFKGFDGLRAPQLSGKYAPKA